MKLFSPDRAVPQGGFLQGVLLGGSEGVTVNSIVITFELLLCRPLIGLLFLSGFLIWTHLKLIE